MWQTENGNFESFFSLLLLSLKIWKIRILKRWKTLLGISSFYACVPKTTIIWGTVPEIKSEKEIIFCHFVLFFAPLPYNQPEKSKFWKNEKKKPTDIIILHLSTTEDNHMMYVSWDMEGDRQNFLSFWTIFVFLSNNPEN